jgi:HD-GYP domain-containing protein (c-di-GMP phosphodiesterase class II)
MRRAFPQIATWAIAGGLPMGAFFWLKANGAHDAMIRVPTGHFYVVSAVSVLSAAMALLAVLGAMRTASARITLLALSFISMAGLFAVHGLATPGFLVEAEYRAVLGFSSRMSIVLAAAFLALSAIDLPQELSQRVVKWRGAILGGWVMLLLSYALAALIAPESVPPRIMSEVLFLRGTNAVVFSFSLFATIRYFQGYQRSGLAMYNAMAIGSLLLFEAQFTMHFGEVWHLSWWIYHFALFSAFLLMLGGMALEYVQGNSPVLVMQGLTLSDPIAQIQAGYTRVITAFAASLEARDGYTHGHGQRVAALSLLIGERMGLAPGRLRGLAQGALLHDVGKIGVPDRILCKPGPLTDDEYCEIQRHPERGEALLGSAFTGPVESAVIRHHHERYDGTGYPDRLRGADIPLEARIASVADVYDALRSARAYRGAWDREVAQQYMREQSGSHFDPTCIAAFFQVVDRWEEQFSADAEGEASVRQLAAA